MDLHILFTEQLNFEEKHFDSHFAGSLDQHLNLTLLEYWFYLVNVIIRRTLNLTFVGNGIVYLEEQFTRYQCGTVFEFLLLGIFIWIHFGYFAIYTFIKINYFFYLNNINTRCMMIEVPFLYSYYFYSIKAILVILVQPKR